MKYLLNFVLLLICFSARAQSEYVFNHLNVENGLVQSSVLSIAQDARGFIWLGTRFGLSKYDSRTFKSYQYTKGDPHGLTSSEYISSILSTRTGDLWIGTSHGLNKYNETHDNFDQILAKNADQRGLSDSKINCIYEDREKRLWIGTGNGLNLLTSKKNYQFQQFLNHGKFKRQVYVTYEDHNGTLWLGTSSGLMSLKIKNNQAHFNYFKSFSDQLNRHIDNHVTSIVEDAKHNLWIGTKQSGLSKFNLQTKKITTYTNSNLNQYGISSNNIRKIIIDSDDKIWIGTLHGINVYDPNTGRFTALQTDPGNPSSLSQNSVYDIFQDRQKIIWAGTYYGGVNMIYPNYSAFKLYKSSKNKNGLSSNVISAITEDNKHNLWIGTEGEGVNYYDKNKKVYTHYRYNPNDAGSLSSNLVKAIIQDKDERVWIGTHLGGLNLFNPATKKFIHFKSRKNDPQSLSNDEITSLFEDSFGRFWVGTNNGLNSFDPSKGTFVRGKIHNVLHAISFIFEDREKILWVATNSGLYELRPGEKDFRIRKAKNPGELPYNDVSCMLQDKRGFIWIGTFRNGLFKLDAKRHAYKKISTSEGLPSNNIVGILEDDLHMLWISTDNGLCKFDPNLNSFKNFNIKDGLPGNEFNYKSVLKDSKGEFFFGSLKGLISFHPNEILENKNTPPAVFTNLKLFNKEIALNGEEGILKQNISLTKKITFKASQNIFTLDFSVLNFIKPSKNQYAYKLDGFERNWNYVDLPSASYTNLSPGNYTLMVKGSNNDGVWSNQISTLAIEVLPPYYRTWWAYMFYIAVLSAVLLLGLRYLLIRAVLKKEKEINEHKLEFFTNISHEIRTPLTLILGPLEKLLDESQDQPVLNRALHPIKNNADRLMHLITELMDFRKAESGKLALHVSPGNIVKFCREIFIAFQNLAAMRQIEYSFQSSAEDIELYFDKVQLEKVLFNLLSNAFKFAPNNGYVRLIINNEHSGLTICVLDNGPGIPKNEQTDLFQNFYQAGNSSGIGTGIGLALSKSIMELHHGKIWFERYNTMSEDKAETCFSILLKFGKEHFSKSEFIADYVYYDDVCHYTEHLETEHTYVQASPEDTHSSAVKPNILLVEDNTEVRNYLKTILDKDYKIIEAENGLEGLKKAVDFIPDLVISDVMMPVMDGLELCRKLKTDERTSHIPVILLTARSAYVHQVNGLEHGADVYILKPFNTKILRLNVENLITGREMLRKKFSQLIVLEPKSVLINETEQLFLNKVIGIIEAHLSDLNFDVAKLAMDVGMSQPVLYKKIRALTDLSVNDFMKSIRLKSAAKMFNNGFISIAEVAYAVGFNDRKYFSIEFKKYFGKTPSEFLQEQSKN
ncbi:two-component regulator propeller domain-containing protein [Pedobacter sp. AW1-32]|uniref:hybrid sensor histidine kinase/response regulator transcription factor n=1 Tax=Pedobacter sp. AW1-32 TaxID=3383026 RepID=UPI003FED8E02